MTFPVQSTGFSDAPAILGAAGIPTFVWLRINPVVGFILVGLRAVVGTAGFRGGRGAVTTPTMTIFDLGNALAEQTPSIEASRR